MSEKAELVQDTEQAQDDGKGKSAQGVADYLTAPRKKRRSFIVIATGANTDSDTVQAIVRFVKATYPKFAVATPQSGDEFKRQFTRNINLVVIEDTFVGLEETMALVKTMKQQKTDGAIPVLFLTRDPDSLVRAYSKTLAVWHEVDEYIVPALTPRPYLYAKIKSGVEDRYRRRSRRFKLNFPVAYSLLDVDGKKFQGSLVDLSIHGAQLIAADGQLFNPRDQLIVHLPYSNFISDGKTDVIRLSAKIRRIYISGDRAGIRWEHMSEGKTELVSRMLTTIVDQTLARQAASARAKIARAEAEDAESNNRNVAKPAPKEKEKEK